MDTANHAAPGTAPENTLVGRGKELDQFRTLFARVLGGRCQVLLMSGDPGIGKTALAEAVAEAAEDLGALTLWGRCYEEPGAPPYWPWTQVLRSYVEASSLDEVRLTLQDGAEHIAAVLPELGDQRGGTAAESGDEFGATRSRFQTFDSVARFLSNASEQVPLVLIFDNLHWADAPSLSLLEFCCDELQRRPVLICGTYRDAEVTRKSPLLETLGGLNSKGGVTRLHLRGLSAADMAPLAHDLQADALAKPVLAQVWEHTDGNPLFARELIKYLLDELDDDVPAQRIAIQVPDGIRATIGRRLSRLSDECNALLSTAAVLGRYFGTSELSLLMPQSVEEILGQLDPAVRARIVEPTGDPGKPFRFTHAVIRETLYEELTPLERLQLHGKAGDAVMELHPDCPPAVLPVIAHHYGEAASLGNGEKAAALGLRAARSATAVGAYEEAVSHYDRVIEVLELFGSKDDERIATAFLNKGIVLKELGSVEKSIEALLNAVYRMRTLSNAELLVHVIMRLTISSSHVAHGHLIPLLEMTLDALPEEDSVARAQCLATLAFAGRDRLQPEKLQSLLTDALETAARIESDDALCSCHHLAQMALRTTPDTLPQRLALSEQHSTAARSTENADLIAEAYHWQALNLLETGDVESIETLLRRFSKLSAAEYGLHQYRVESCRITLSLIQGRWAGLEQRIEALRNLGRKTRGEDAEGVYGAQMFALNRELGRLAQLAPALRQLAAQPVSAVWQPGLMFMCAELGLLDEAREIFERYAQQDFTNLCRDEMYITCLVFCAETCASLDDASNAERLFELLQPYEGATANHPTAVCYGAVSHFLGLLARTAGNLSGALTQFEAALEKHRQMEAWPLLARTLFHYALTLRTADPAGNARTVDDTLREAERLAERLGMSGLMGRLAEANATTSDAPAPDGLTAREIEVLDLLAIGRSNKDIAKVLSISLNTVATHVRSILSKTGCANRTEAAAYATNHGLNTPSTH